MNEDIVRKLQREKNKNNPAAAIVITVILFIFGSFVTLIVGMPKLIILWIILCIAIVGAIIWNEKKQEKFIDLVKSGKILIKETNIIDFEDSSTGYYIISSDGSNTYKSNLLERAFLYRDNPDADENKKHFVLKSDNGDFLIGDRISVYVDPNNPKNYFVDL